MRSDESSVAYIQLGAVIINFGSAGRNSIRISCWISISEVLAGSALTSGLETATRAHENLKAKSQSPDRRGLK